jgi:hypothetical protein
VARIDMLIVSLPLTAQARVLSMLKKLWVLPVDIRMSAHSSELRFRPRAYSYIGSVPLLDIFDKPINDWDSVAKRGLRHRLQPARHHPLLADHDRHGDRHQARQQGAGALHAEAARLQQRRDQRLQVPLHVCGAVRPDRQAGGDQGRPAGDRVGRFIRKTSIDELPQFFNALNGSLSLVGPRPHAVAGQTRNRLYHEVVDGYFARHKVKPGVTGWAQINGWRGEIDSDEKIRMRTEYDLHYIENWSLWFDLKILFLTPISLLKSENAY